MKLETFFEKFEVLAEAPNAVEKMRQLVLQLAVRGRLAQQSLSDVPASELSVQIAHDRESFVKARGLSRQRVIPPVRKADYPFEPPSGWLWTRLGNLCRVQAGFAFASAAFQQGSSGVPIIRIRDITSDRTQASYLGEYREEFLVEAGDYLVGMDGNFRIAKWRGPRALLNQRVSRLQWYSNHLEPSFFAIAAQYRLSELQGARAYTTVDHLSSGQIENAIVPLPPLAEQKRIVAKVDELMALCDRLEAQQQEREARHATLARASLARFAEAPTPANLGFLFHKSYDITPADLRKTMLTLAAQGKLVSQDSNDEPAEDCLSRLGLRSTVASPCGDDIESDSLPPGWARVKFEDVALVSGGITLGRKLGDRKTISLPYLRVANVKRGEVDLTVVKEIAIGEDEIERYALRENDLLMTEGGDWDKVGRAAIWRGEISVCLHQNHVFRARMRSIELVPVWFERYFNSPIGRGYFESAAKQTTNLASINMRQVRACPILFPPLAEQRRIVAKVDRLVALVDQLEAKLATSGATGARLLEAVVCELTSSGQRN